MHGRQYPEALDVYSRLRSPFHQHRSLAEEFGRSWISSSVGLIMIFLGITGIVYNEGRAVTTSRALEEGSRKVIVPETNDVIFDENQGKLVLVADQLSITDPLEELDYGISVRAVNLKKEVEMFQWYEMEDPRPSSSSSPPSGLGDHDGHVTYSYGTAWFDRLIDSESFRNKLGHHNPDVWFINGTLKTNSRAKLGAFLLSSDLKEKFTNFQPFTSDERPRDRMIKMHAGLYYHAEDVWKPEVGDMRLQFSYAGLDGDTVTVVGRQSERGIGPYKTETGQELLMLHQGLLKPEEVFYYERLQKRFDAWMGRLAAWFVSFLGFICINSLLDHFVNKHSHLRNTLELGYTSLPFSFSLSATLTISGLNWITYRPLVGGPLLVIASLPFLLAAVREHRRRQSYRRHRLT